MPIITPSLSRIQHQNTNIDPTSALAITLTYDNAPAQCVPYRVPKSVRGIVAEEEDDMGLAYNVYLNADRIFGCKNCKTHLATHDSIISRVSPPVFDQRPVFLYPRPSELGARLLTPSST